MAKKKKSGLGFRGDDMWAEEQRAVAKIKRNEERRKKGLNNVYRFFVKHGEEAEIVFLDDDVNDGIALWEHQLIGADGNPQDPILCFSGSGRPCPICKAHPKPAPYLGLIKTVLQLNAYEDKNGEWRHERRLLVMKPKSAERYKTILKAAQEEHGTTRGVYMLITRGSDSTSAAVGEPTVVPESGGRMFSFLDEEELEEYGNEEVIGKKDKKVLMEAGVNLLPYDYDEVFQLEDEERLYEEACIEFGTPKIAGSAADIADDFEEDEAPKKSTRSRRTKVADEPKKSEKKAPPKKTAKPKPSKEEPDEEAEEEQSSFTELGAILDAGDGEEEDEDTFNSACEMFDLDPNEYGTWEALGAVIDKALAKKKAAQKKAPAKKVAAKKTAKKKPEPAAKKKESKWVALGKSIDEAEDDDDVDADIDAMEKACAKYVLDGDDYDSWEETGRAIAEKEAEEANDTGDKKTSVKRKRPGKRKPAEIEEEDDEEEEEEDDGEEDW